jgi:hypothetical protein
MGLAEDIPTNLSQAATCVHALRPNADCRPVRAGWALGRRPRRLKLDDFITRVYSLEGINKASAAMKAGEAVRSIAYF